MTGEDDEGKSDFNKIFWRICWWCEFAKYMWQHLEIGNKSVAIIEEKSLTETFSLLVHGGKYFMDSFLKTNMSVANLDLA